MVKFKDTDFLHASARVKSLEKKLLTSRQLTQMVDAHSLEEAYKIVNDAGIGVGGDVSGYESALKESLQDTYQLMGELSGGRDIFNIFRYEYDGLNLKTAVKAHALDQDPVGAMTEMGTVKPADLAEMLRVKKLDKVHPALAQGALEALDVLAKTGDPQAVDIILDKAVLSAMLDKAMAYDSKFVQKYVRSKIDISNIRSLVRVKRMDQSLDFFKKVLSPGGTMGENAFVDAYAKGMDGVIALIESSSYGTGLEPAMASLRAGESLSLFEKQCDNYMVRLMDEARLIPFGIEPLIVYISAKENEIKAARIVLASRMAGVAPELIKERLRESYA